MKHSRFKKFNADEFLKRFNEHVSKFLPMEFEQESKIPPMKTVTSVTSVFLTNNEIGNSCKPLQNKGYRGDVTPVTFVTPKNDNSKNYIIEQLEERVAIIEYDGQIPYEWAEAIVKTQTRIKPLTISNNKWNEIQNALKTLLPQLETIIFHDWRLSDIFGCHPIVPEKRFDVMGLLMLLNEGDRIIEVTRDVIRIQNNRGVVNSYSRQFCNYQTERSFLYEIESSENAI